jgi:hypothetical protein
VAALLTAQVVLRACATEGMIAPRKRPEELRALVG